MADLFSEYEQNQAKKLIQDENVKQQATANVIVTDIKQVERQPTLVKTTETSSNTEDETTNLIKATEQVKKVNLNDSSINKITHNISNSYSLSITPIDAISLMEMEFPDVVPIVKNLLYPGLALIASMPKLGKSWYCLQLGLAIVTGSDFLGLATNKCDVLYLSLEDTLKRLQDRMKKLLQDDTVPQGLHFSTMCQTLDNGLIDTLQEVVNKNPKIRLIIIDTLQFIRSRKSGGGTLYNKEYKEMCMLKEFANSNKICVLVVHHLNQKKSADTFSQINGSNGIRGATDVNLVLEKMKDDPSKVILSVEGRDVESTTKVIKRNEITCKWEVVANDVNLEEMKYRNNPIVIAVNKMLEETPEGITPTTTEIKDKMCIETEIDEEEYSTQAISHEIREHLIPLFMRYDNIRCKKPNKNGGTQGRRWYFSYQKDESVSETEETNVDDIDT